MFLRTMTPQFDPEFEEHLVHGNLDVCKIELNGMRQSMLNNVVLLSIKHGHLHILEYLRSIGVKLSGEHLTYAAKMGQLEILIYIIQSGVIPFGTNDNSLIAAAANGRLNTVEYLFNLQDIIYPGMSPCTIEMLSGNIIFSHITEALNRAVANGNLCIVKFFLEHGVNKVTYLFNSKYVGVERYKIASRLLPLAIENNHARVLEYLLSLNVDLHWNNDYPLQVAVNKGNVYCAGMLISHGASIENSQSIHLASIHDDLEMLSYLKKMLTYKA